MRHTNTTTAKRRPKTATKPATTSTANAPTTSPQPRPDRAVELDDDRAWTDHDVAAFLRCSARSVRELIGDDATFPGHVVVAGRRLFDPDAVRAWLREQTARTTRTSRRPARPVRSTGVRDRV